MSTGAAHRQGAPLWRKLVDDLQAEIRSGARAPGSKLPSVAEQETLGVSQSTTMRAYRELASMGLTVAVTGSGTYVADPVPAPTAPATLENLAERVRALEEWRRRVEGTG
jgi:DNA-binding GntR family transcriptional regulator